MERPRVRRFVDVEIRFFRECPNYTLAVKRVHEALKRAHLAGVDVRLVEVADAQRAEELRFIGSPTILINGRDPFSPRAEAGYGLTCRLYDTASGSEGSPSTDQLEFELRRAARA